MDSKFNVVYSGLQQGINAEDFIEKFCKKFAINKKKAQQIAASGSDIVIKKELDKKKAMQFQAAFESCGMIIQLKEIPGKVEAPSGLSLEPMDDSPRKVRTTQTEEQSSVEALDASLRAKEDIPETAGTEQLEDGSVASLDASLKSRDDISGNLKTARADEQSPDALNASLTKGTSPAKGTTQTNNASIQGSGQAVCPKCGSDQIVNDECQSCGIFIAKYLQTQKTIFTSTPIDNTDENDSNPYATPEASLERNIITREGQGSVEGALNGDYDFTIGDIYREAWEQTNGVKGTFLMAWGLYMGIAMAISWLFYFLPFDSQGIIESLVNIPVLYPVMAGITLMGIHHSVGADIRAASVFDHYSKVVPISLLMILMIILIMLGTILLVIPGIYLGIAYMMALSLMMDRDTGVWESLEISRKAITKHWFKIFFIYCLLGLLMLLAMMPLFIGLIWVLPLSSVMHGIMYKKMFGVESVE